MIRIVLPAQPEEHVAFAVSPLLECVLSLHVLLGPKHHALHHDWVRRMRTLDPALRREIETLGFVYRRPDPRLLLPTRRTTRRESFEQELARFRALAPELSARGLGRPLYDHGGEGAGVFAEPGVRAAMLAPGRRRRGTRPRSCSTDPAEFADRLAAMLERYWEDAFAAEWERIEPLLARSIVEAGRLLAAAGIWPVLGRLPAHCRIDPERRELPIDLPHEHAVDGLGRQPARAQPERLRLAAPPRQLRPAVAARARLRRARARPRGGAAHPAGRAAARSCARSPTTRASASSA